ncbi:MAG: CobW family GTP-binding protein [Candidatus Latescibacterota bacterium]
MARTPMLLVGGTLGSGKTTLLRRLLQHDLGRLALIVNEFGELGIDGSLLRGRSVELVELAGGCVCCTLAGDFQAAVAELVRRVRPELIAVETTGLAEADALVLDVEEVLPQVRLEVVVVLVDADGAVRFPQWGHAERTQVEAADILLINKVDLVDSAAVDALEGRLRRVNPQAAVQRAVRARLDPALLYPRLPARSARSRAARPNPEHPLTSVTWQPSGTSELDRDAFARAVAGWPPQVLRAKGRVHLEGQPYLFNYVAGRWELERLPAGQEGYGLVLIGEGVQSRALELCRGLEECVHGRGA